MNIETFKEHLPIGYEVPDEFQKCLARFMRFVSLEGDILRINYNSYGKYLHQFYYRLSDDEQQALIELGMMLDLIQEDMLNLPSNDGNILVELPEVLATPEAMILWKKVQRAGYANANYQPTVSRPEAAVLAYEMAKRLGVEDKWKAFETLWNRRNMYRDYHTAINQKKSLTFRDDLKAVLG